MAIFEDISIGKEKQLEKLLYQTIKAALMQDMEVPNIQARKENQKEKIEIQELQFTYPRDQEVKKLHTEVNDSFVHYDGKPKQTITEESRVQVDKVEPKKHLWKRKNKKVSIRNRSLAKVNQVIHKHLSRIK